MGPMCEYTGSPLIQVITYHLFGAKPLLEPTHTEWTGLVGTNPNLNQNTKLFAKKINLKMWFANCWHFVQA